MVCKQEEVFEICSMIVVKISFVFKYFYTRFFIESLGTTIKPFVYYGFGNIYLLLLSGIILVALGSLLGKIFGR